MGILRPWLIGLALVAMSSPSPADAPKGSPESAFIAFLKGDYATAARYAPQWAELGDATNEAILGWMYVSGKGMPFLPAHGLDWLIKSAEQDNDVAFQLLGSIYDTGALFTADHVTALSWMILATRNTPSVIFPDSAVRDRQRLERSLTAEQLAKARLMAKEWLEKHPPPPRTH